MIVGRWIIVQATHALLEGRYFARRSSVAFCAKAFKNVETARPWVYTDAGIVPLCEQCKAQIRGQGLS